MKSGKQRRQEIKQRRAHHAEQQARRAHLRTVDRPHGSVPVTWALLRPTTRYGISRFVERGYDEALPFRCKDCGKEDVWTAEQRWWYEVAQGAVWTTAVRCRAYRQQERKRQAEAHRIHLEGMAAKRERAARRNRC